MILLKPDFHEHILLHRLRLGMDQTAMAKEAKISQGYLSAIEWGLRPVSETVRRWFESHMDLHEYNGTTLTDGEQFRLAVRRKGLNMGQAAKHFRVSEATLLAWMRSSVDVPYDAWNRL